MVPSEAVLCHFTGRVQGVYFRVQIRDRALELGLAGWVKNLPDGRVEAHLEGAPQAIRELLEWTGISLRRGRVDDIHREAVDSEGFETFTIRY